MGAWRHGESGDLDAARPLMVCSPPKSRSSNPFGWTSSIPFEVALSDGPESRSVCSSGELPATATLVDFSKQYLSYSHHADLVISQFPPHHIVYAEKYAEDLEAFFKDYAESHAKLSELGAKFDPPEGITIDKPSTQPSKQPVPEKFVAAKYSSDEGTKKELSDAMKAKIRAEYLGLGGSPDQPLKTNYFLNIMIVIAVLAILSSFVVNNNNGF